VKAPEETSGSLKINHFSMAVDPPCIAVGLLFKLVSYALGALGSLPQSLFAGFETFC